MMTPPPKTPAKTAPAMTPKRLTAAEVLKRYDKNGDGKIDDDERAEAREQMMQEQLDRQMARAAATPGGPEAFRAFAVELFDANRDGQLDDTERAAARAFAERFVNGANGDVREELRRRFDKNANGQIDPGERAEFIAHLKALRDTPPSAAKNELERQRLESVAEEVAKRREKREQPGAAAAK